MLRYQRVEGLLRNCVRRQFGMTWIDKPTAHDQFVATHIQSIRVSFGCSSHLFWSVSLLKMLKGCSGKSSAAKNLSDRIDKELIASAKESVVKLPLLGVADSGKSTFVKQMKIIHDDAMMVTTLMN